MENGPGPGREEIAKMEKINFNQEEPKADEALKKEINQGQEKEPVPKLELPEEPEMVKGLQDMLAEYKKHVEKKWGEVTHLWNPVSAYETSIIAVLEKLLADGKVDVHNFSRELKEKDAHFNSSEFEDACWAINYYLDFGRERNREQVRRIKFPENIEMVKALQEKLAEYKNRLVLQKEKNPHRPPETFTDTNYKIAVLEKLLTDGEVSAYKLFEELLEKDGSLNEGVFENALAVISDYVQTGGENARRVRRP